MWGLGEVVRILREPHNKEVNPEGREIVLACVTGEQL